MLEKVEPDGVDDCRVAGHSQEQVFAVGAARPGIEHGHVFNRENRLGVSRAAGFHFHALIEKLKIDIAEGNDAVDLDHGIIAAAARVFG